MPEVESGGLRIVDDTMDEGPPVVFLHGLANERADVFNQLLAGARATA